MLPRYAVMLDGGFVVRKLRERLGHFPTAADVIAEVARLKGHAILANHELLRVYFYHAPPPERTITNPIDKSKINLKTGPEFQPATQLLKDLEQSQDFALRMGEVVFRGWQLGSAALINISKGGARPIRPRDVVPNLEQKGVDLRIGLDIARLSLRELVRVIVVVTGDSDMIPAFKFARREGVRIYLDHMGHGVNDHLKAHTDFVFP
jgi:uncharacterized LabA/DUF88 family protein